MASIFNNSKTKSGTQRENLETKYNSSIMNILLVVVFSLVNVVLLVVNSNSYFLFSAFIPYFLADYGMYTCGMYPEEYYYDVPDMVFSDKSTLVVTFVIAAVIVLFYLLCWFFAKKKKVGWLIAALVLFIIDTLAMFAIAGISTELIMDIVFHVWVIVSLVNGIVNYNKLKSLPEETMELVTEEEDKQYYFEQYQDNSGILRTADSEVKERILLEAETPGYHIIYRRVKRTNELVVNGMVYDEYEALVEFPHTLTAMVNGHKIEVKYDATSYMYIMFDGEQLAKKIRLI